MPRLLVVSATRAEAAHLPDGVDLVITGIGKTAAAVATATALARGDTGDLLVLNAGTAGALRPGLTGLFTPSVVLNHDLSAHLVRALGYDPQERLELDGGDGSVLATGDTFVTDAAARDTLAERADLVDMEGYAVAYACLRAGVPVRLVKHVSDAADDTALDWPEVVDRSARVLGEWVAGQLG